MVRKFVVNVNGTAYNVEVEEVNEVPAACTTPAATPVAAPAPAAAPAPVAASGAQSSVTAPMPGSILDVKVKVGDTVDENTVVVLLEAMKMENEVFATAAGKVVAVNVAKGATVNSGDCLVVIG